MCKSFFFCNTLLFSEIFFAVVKEIFTVMIEINLTCRVYFFLGYAFMLPYFVGFDVLLLRFSDVLEIKF